MSGVDPETARAAMDLAASKLPIKTKFLNRADEI
jgi:ribosomal protein L16/L10AE